MLQTFASLKDIYVCSAESLFIQLSGSAQRDGTEIYYHRFHLYSPSKSTTPMREMAQDCGVERNSSTFNKNFVHLAEVFS